MYTIKTNLVFRRTLENRIDAFLTDHPKTSTAIFAVITIISSVLFSLEF